MRPFFSIGVTTFDRMTMLLECLDSISKQSFTDFEVLIGNDNTSRSLSAADLGLSDFRFHFINHSKNLGEMGNMNLLLRRSRGRYFTWLADDDLFLPGALESVRNAIHQGHRPHCIFGSYAQGEKYAGEVTEKSRADQVTGEEFLSGYLQNKYRLQGCYGFFRRNAVIRLGGMQKLGSGSSPYADVLLAIRASQLTRISYLPTNLVYYRTHSGSLSMSTADIRSYSTAQKDLLQESDLIFSLPAFRAKRLAFLGLLVARIRRDYFEVLRRTGAISTGDILNYFSVTGRYIFVARGYRKTLIRDSLKSIAEVIVDLKRSPLLNLLFHFVRLLRRKRKI